MVRYPESVKIIPQTDIAILLVFLKYTGVDPQAASKPFSRNAALVEYGVPCKKYLPSQWVTPPLGRVYELGSTLSQKDPFHSLVTRDTLFFECLEMRPPGLMRACPILMKGVAFQGIWITIGLYCRYSCMEPSSKPGSKHGRNPKQPFIFGGGFD